MKPIYRALNLTSLLKVQLITSMLLVVSITHAAIEPGFIPLLEGSNASQWRQCGLGGFKIANGSGTTWFPDKGYFGIAWFSQRTFGDFILKTEWRGAQREHNSGIRLRFPDPGNEPGRVSREGYEVSIMWEEYDSYAKNPDMRTGGIAHEQPPSVMPIIKQQGAWNELEVTVIGQKYTVKVNGALVNEFTGARGLVGYIGIENHKGGPVEFRNLRVKDLAPFASSVAAVAAPAAPLAMIQSDPNQPRIEVLKDQGPNALEWAMAPLDQALPPDIRQNLTYLREDLLDEAKQKPKAGANAYTLGSQLCDKLLIAIQQRGQASVQAGYTAAQADADVRVTSQALEARRNYKMSWPQFARETSQRAEIGRQQMSAAELKKEKTKVEWASRADVMRPILDGLYRQFREALR